MNPYMMGMGGMGGFGGMGGMGGGMGGLGGGIPNVQVDNRTPREKYVT